MLCCFTLFLVFKNFLDKFFGNKIQNESIFKIENKHNILKSKHDILKVDINIVDTIHTSLVLVFSRTILFYFF